MDLFIGIGIILGLILANGLFVAAEFAIVTAPRSTFWQRANGGSRIGEKVFQIMGEPALQDRYIATAQLGITLASLGLGMYGEHQLAAWFLDFFEGQGATAWLASHSAASAISVALLTYLHIVIGEMVPKSLALFQPDRTVMSVTPLMLAFQTITYPLVIVLNGIGTLTLRLLGIRRELTGEHQFTKEELEHIVSRSRAEGLLSRDSGRLLWELLDFDELRAGEIMVPRVRIIGIPVGCAPSQVREILSLTPHTLYPIFDGSLDDIVGYIHVKSLLRNLQENRPVSRSDAHPIPFIPETASVESAITVLRTKKASILVVMDEFGGTAGILSVEDLLEELVGEIDEARPEIPEIVIEAKGRIRCLGTARLEEIAEVTGLPLDHSDVDTVSGLVLTLLGRPPRVGDETTYANMLFRVLSVRGHGVDKCLILASQNSES